MTFTEKHFVYDGINSRQYNLIIAHINTETIKNICGTVEIQKIFNRNTMENSIIGQKYDDSALEVDIEFISDTPLSRVEQRKIKKWLFNNSEYKRLYIDESEDEERERINGEVKQCYVNCIFTSPEIIEYGGVYGYKAKMQLSSPFAFQDKIVITQTNSNAGYGDTNKPMYVQVDVDSDVNGFIYPIITLKRVQYTGDELTDYSLRIATKEKEEETTEEISDTNSKYVKIGTNYYWKNNKLQEKAEYNECYINDTPTDTIDCYVLNSKNNTAIKEIGSLSSNADVKNGKYLILNNGTNYIRFPKNVTYAKIEFQNVRWIR